MDGVDGSSERLASVRDAVDKACTEAGRDPASVTLVAISKTFDADAIEPVIACGQRVFGENRVQEAKAKWPGLQERHPGIELHLVGSLQSNKARDAVALFDAIHSLDRPSLAQALAQEIARQGRSPLLFVEINTGAEPQKAGVLPEAADDFLKACRETYGLAIAGLMCIPPADEPPGAAFRAHRQDRAAQRAEAAVDGHERRFRHRDRVRRHPCAGRHGDLRRTDPAGGITPEGSADVDPRPRPEVRQQAIAARRTSIATQPAVGPRFGRATWTNTALPRPAMRGRVLWSSSMMRSYSRSSRHSRSPGSLADRRNGRL